MKTAFLFPLLMSSSSWVKLDLNLPNDEKIRSFCMTPSKHLYIGTNQGNIHTFDYNQKQHSVFKIDSFPIYHLEARSGGMVMAESMDNRVSFLDPVKRSVHHSIHWKNISVSQLLTPSGKYLRLSSNHWLSIFDVKKNKNMISKQLPLRSFVVDGTIFQENFCFYLTINWQLGVFDLNSTESFSLKIPNMSPQNIPRYMRVHALNQHKFRVLIGGTKETKVFNLMLGENKKIDVYRTFSFPSKKGVFIGVESYAMVSEKNQINIFSPQRFLEEYRMETEFISKIQFVEPYLIINQEDQVRVLKWLVE